MKLLRKKIVLNNFLTVLDNKKALPKIGRAFLLLLNYSFIIILNRAKGIILTMIQVFFFKQNIDCFVQIL